MMSVFHSRNFVALALLSFIAVAMFCLWTTAVMAADNDMNSMGSCMPYGTEAVSCSTNAESHIAAWQNFSNVIPQKTFDLLLSVSLVVFASVAYKTVWPRTPEVVRSARTKARVLDIIDPLKLALARGIIQPKIYPSHIG